MRRANLKTKIMNEAEKLLEKFARKNMIEWDQESFKKSHRRLHKSIIEAINEALRIHDVVGQSELLCDHPRSERSYIGQNMLRCNKCGKEFS